MQKIKEIFHKDSQDKDTKRDSSTHSHTAEDVLNEQNFQRNHVHHGEIEHRNLNREVVHEHGHNQQLRSGEKHVYHEREVLQDGGNLYQSGVDPTLNREIVNETRHDGGETRQRVGEAEVIREKIKEVELHKVQPVIHRDREQKEIRHVVEPHQQYEVKDTHIAHHEKDIDLGSRREASTLETSRSMGGAPQIESSREFLGTERQHQELPMQLEEHVHRKVEEHVHPVIYKETLKPKVTEEIHHLYETVKEHPVETYEVKEVLVHGDGSTTQNAERAFFEEHSNRGIDINNSRSLNQHSQCAGCSGGTQTIETTNLSRGASDFSSGHHQNIGAHHLPASAIAGGHNTAYDAALCNQCTGNAVCSHSEKDATLMQKMNEKKLAKDEKLQDKQAKKASKGKLDKNTSAVV